MRTKKKKTAESGRKAAPVLKKEITRFLNSEEAKITSRSLLTGSLTLFCLGVTAEHAIATHYSHTNYQQNHYSVTGHGNTNTHANGNAGTSSITPHHDATPHANTTALGVAHVSGHANGAMPGENVTFGQLHNDATAGYGKHSAGTGHYSLAPHVNNNVSVDGSGHASTNPHSSAGIHSNTAHHANASNPDSFAQHYNLHASGNDGHSSHGSHGQW